MEFVLKTITERTSVKFSELFATAANRAEVVCTFLALLELIRLKQLACVQPEPFAEIEVSKAVAQAVLAEHAGQPTELEPERSPAAAKLLAETHVDEDENERVDGRTRRRQSQPKSLKRTSLEDAADTEVAEEEDEDEEEYDDDDDDDDDDGDDGDEDEVDEGEDEAPAADIAPPSPEDPNAPGAPDAPKS